MACNIHMFWFNYGPLFVRNNNKCIFFQNIVVLRDRLYNFTRNYKPLLNINITKNNRVSYVTGTYTST